MVRAVLDTHGFLWYMFGDARLSSKARDAQIQRSDVSTIW
jgi:PIN domain nuclease of toxin-antitoxin system